MSETFWLLAGIGTMLLLVLLGLSFVIAALRPCAAAAPSEGTPGK